MSSVTVSLFKTIVEELLTYREKRHKVFKGSQVLNGIIRHAPNGYMGVIIDGRRIYRFTLNAAGEIDMDIRLSEHLIMINTENSMRIFTASSVLLEYPVVRSVKRSVSDTPFWAGILNYRYELITS